MKTFLPFPFWKALSIMFASIFFSFLISVLLSGLGNLITDPIQHESLVHVLALPLGLFVTLLCSLCDQNRFWAGLLGGGTITLLWAVRTFGGGRFSLDDDPYSVMTYLALGYVLGILVLYVLKRFPMGKR